MNRAGVDKVLARLRERKDPSPLAPKGPRDNALNKEIESLISDADPEADRLVKSVLHLWNDNLERSHEISQEIKSTTGSYLHGVMHRREPDYGNSSYWFRKVGAHPVFADVLEAAKELLEPESGGSKELQSIRRTVQSWAGWDGFRMIHWCEASDKGAMPDDVTSFLEALQAREIAALADYCLARTKG